MKTAIAAMLVALSMHATAVDVAGMLMPTPLSIVLAYNTYVKDSKKVYYIKVQSQASDFEQAKKQAFRLASEQVAGTVVLSESELRNSRLTRDEIITYSSGLIDEYKIVDRVDGLGFVKLTMDVWIAESVMAQRLLAKSASDRGVDGSALATRVDSILEERQRGDRLLMTILRDMPRHGFKVSVNPAKIRMDDNRNVLISVFINVRWDERYIAAFTDAAGKIGRRPEPLCMFNCAPQNYWLNGYVVDDIQKLRTVVDYVKNTSPTLKLELQDQNGTAVSRICSRLPMTWDIAPEPGKRTFLAIDVTGTSVTLDSKAGVSGDVYFSPLGQNTAQMMSLTEIKAEVVTQSQCRSF